MKKRLIIEGDALEIAHFINILLDRGVDFTVKSILGAEASKIAQPAPIIEPKKRTLTKRSPDGRTPREVVEQKCRSMGTKKFHISEITSLSHSVGFHPDTLRQGYQALVREGVLIKKGRYFLQNAPAAPPQRAEEAKP